MCCILFFCLATPEIGLEITEICGLVKILRGKAINEINKERSYGRTGFVQGKRLGLC